MPTTNLQAAQIIADHIQTTPQEINDPYLSAQIVQAYALLSIAHSLETIARLQEDEQERKATTPEGFGAP